MSQLFTQSQRAERCTLSLEQAVYHTCKNERGLIGKICEIYGLNYNTVSAKIDINKETHTLSPDVVEYVLTHAKDKTSIMDAICNAHGNAGWFMLPNANELSQFMRGVAEMGQRFADANTTLLDAYADHVITIDECHAIDKDCSALISQLQALKELARIKAGVKR